MGQHEGARWWRSPNGRLTAVVDGDFVHIGGLRALNMSWCTRVTDAAFVHLRGIKELDMSYWRTQRTPLVIMCNTQHRTCKKQQLTPTLP